MTPESLTNSKKRCKRQLWLLLGVLFVVACFMNYYKTHSSDHKKSDTETVDKMATDRLHVSAPQPDNFEIQSFKSDKKFDKFMSDFSDKKFDKFSADGELNYSSFTMYGIITNDGNILGRYHNANGTRLDVNGKINPDDGSIDIDLGHGNTHSKMTLTPDDSDNSDDKYEYSGKWGRKKKNVSLNFKIES